MLSFSLLIQMNLHNFSSILYVRTSLSQATSSVHNTQSRQLWLWPVRYIPEASRGLFCTSGNCSKLRFHICLRLGWNCHKSLRFYVLPMLKGQSFMDPKVSNGWVLCHVALIFRSYEVSVTTKKLKHKSEKIFSIKTPRARTK